MSVAIIMFCWSANNMNCSRTIIFCYEAEDKNISVKKFS